MLPGSDAPIAPTHWSFGQIASLVGAPAAYLRQLPGAARRHQPPTEWTAWQLAFQPQLGHPWVALAFTGRLETALEGFEARPDDFFAGSETGA
jgi:hypothetical protein